MPRFQPQAKYSDKQKAKGRIRVGVWVPEDSKKELVKFAAKLCRDQSHSRATS